MKYTVSGFAHEIRNLYPGHYDDLSDIQLVNLWLEKYPNDSEKVEFNSQQLISPLSPLRTKRSSASIDCIKRKI